MTDSPAIRAGWVKRRARIDFWAKVDRRGPDECWPWMGARQTGGGYGIRTVEGKTVYAHRTALSISLGRPLAPGEWALHHCDNPPCCNPSHLFAGTHQDNMRDMTAKGRHRALREWPCPGCGITLRAVRGPGKRTRCADCKAAVTKAKRRRAYLAWRPTVALKDPNWRSRPRDVCPRGHAMEGANVYVVASGVTQGRRMCRACIAIRKAVCARRSDPLTLPQVGT